MKRFLCLALAMLCLLGLTAPACASEVDASADYNTAGKLLKQLWAGSGFSGTLTVELTPNEARAGQALTTQKPLLFNVDYIYTRPTDTAAAAHRLDLSLMENDAAQASAHLSYQDGVAALQSDLIGADWYALTGGSSVRAGTEAGQGSAALSGVKDELNGFLGQTDMPALLSYMLPMALKMQEQTDALADVISTYITRIDLWIAGYRQNATLGKAEDGSTTMTVKYVIPPAAIKSQAEQMVLDLLSDPTTLSKLQALLSAGDAELMLNPQLQKYYFQAIESLPLPSDMTIERTVSLKGDTLALHVLLPMYDAEGGAFTVEYDRVKGESDDLPDQNVITMAGAQRTNTLNYQTYSSMDGVTVYQGSFVSESAGTAGFAVGESDAAADAPQKTLAVAFTLTSKGVEGRDDQDRDTYDYSLSLALAPDTTQGAEGEIAAFEATTLALDARFASKTLKTAATEVDATFTVSGDERANGVKAQLVGKTRKKWEPTALPEKLVDVSAMTDSDFAALLPGVTTRGGALLLSYLSLPTVDATPEATEAPAAGTPTPEVFETLAPGETLAPEEN